MSNVHTVHLHISASFQSSSLNETEFFVYSFELSGTREKRKILLSMGKLMALGYNCYFPITFSFILLFYQLSSVTNLMNNHCVVVKQLPEELCRECFERMGRNSDKYKESHSHVASKNLNAVDLECHRQSVSQTCRSVRKVPFSWCDKFIILLRGICQLQNMVDTKTLHEFMQRFCFEIFKVISVLEGICVFRPCEFVVVAILISEDKRDYWEQM